MNFEYFTFGTASLGRPIQLFTHPFTNLLLPLAVARLFFRKSFPTAFLLMLAANLIDLDHLLADPIYSPGRCSINFHPLHSYYAIAAYVLLLFIPRQKIRLFAIGLLIHIGLDWLDCQI